MWPGATGCASVERCPRSKSPPLSSRNSKALTVSFSRGLCFPCALGTREELRHVLVLGSVIRPPFGGRVPAIVAYGHINAVVNQELCCFIIPPHRAFFQDARRLVRAPGGINIGPALQQERRNLK